MQYIIVVDKQSSANPSSEKRQYILNIDPLKTYNGVSDVLMITVERTYVIRKISVTKYGVPTIMPYPQEEELSKVKINLFEGDNYIYILDEIGNTIIATYILKNDFTDTFPAKVEMNTLIEQTASNIEIGVNKKLEDYSTTEEMRAEIKLESDEINIEVSKKVGKEEVIAAINLSEEEAAIKAEKISLEGLVTVNQKFKVLEDGSIEATDGKFTGDIYLNDGGKVIGGDGLYTNLQYKSGVNDLGYYAMYDYYKKSQLIIYAYIPQGFQITSAIVTLMHNPIYWNYMLSGSSVTQYTWGYARNLRLYNPDSIDRLIEATAFGGEIHESQFNYLPEITNAFGTGGWTPTAPTNSNYKMQSKNSIDIKNYLSAGQNILVIQTANAVPNIDPTVNESIVPYQQTGQGEAVLNVIGYMSPN